MALNMCLNLLGMVGFVNLGFSGKEQAENKCLEGIDEESPKQDEITQ